MNHDSSYMNDTELKTPKTARGLKTRNKLLDAAEKEFGEKGFHDGAISGITQRAGVALGTFYTYFESKEAVFRALVEHMSNRTRTHVASRVAGAPDRLTAEREGIAAYIELVRQNEDLYRIIMEAQFVAEEAYRAHYDRFARAYQKNLTEAAARGEIDPAHIEERAWALIGISVFLGLQYGVWDKDKPAEDVADAIDGFVRYGLDRQER